MRPAADAGILAFGVFANDDPVNLRAKFRQQWPAHAGKKLGGPHIGVLVQPLAYCQPEFSERDVISNVRSSDGAKEDRIEVSQCVDAVRRHHHSGLAVEI